MIKISNLEKQLSQDFILKIPELIIDDGERVAIIGPNGSGKSTLLKLISGTIKPDKGRIEIAVDFKKIGYEPQSPYIFSGDVKKNIIIGSGSGCNVEKLIADCKLELLRSKSAKLLSGGEKGRVCFARMLAGNYKLLLMDEPFSAIDINNCKAMENILLTHCINNDTTLLISTHIPSQALFLASKILIMCNGEVAEYSDAESLINPKSDFGKDFVSLWKI